jgi:hypothetical protein
MRESSSKIVFRYENGNIVPRYVISQDKTHGDQHTILPRFHKYWSGTSLSTMYSCVTSGFPRSVNEVCALLGFYVALSGSFLPTFRDNLSVPSSSVKRCLTLEKYEFVGVKNE